MVILPPVRHQDTLVDAPQRRVMPNWHSWFVTLRDLLNGAVKREKTVRATDQTAAIATTDVPLNQLPAGLYRISVFIRINRAATSSSSVTPTAGWTTGGVACSLAGSAITGNTTATTGGLSTLVRVDKDTAITYETAYASVGATSMRYDIDVVIEGVPS